MFKTTRLLALILALVMVFALALTGCNKGGSTDDDTKASSSDSSSTSKPSDPLVNKEYKALFNKYGVQEIDVSSYFKGMSYVSLGADDNDNGVHVYHYGYSGEELKLYVDTMIQKRESAASMFNFENTDEGLNEFVAMFEEFATITYDEKYVYLIVVCKKGESNSEYYYNNTISHHIKTETDRGYVLKYGKIEDFVKQ